MRLRGRDKCQATREAASMRRLRTRKLSKVASDLAFFEDVEAHEMKDGKRWEPWAIMAWHAGWMRTRQFMKPWLLMRKLWPQNDIYESIYAANPFLAFMKKEPI